MRNLAVVAVIMLLASPLQAKNMSAEELLSNCDPLLNAKIQNDHITFRHTFDSGVCWGTFKNLMDVASIEFQGGSSHPLQWACPPAESSLVQWVKVVKKYIDDHPEEAHHPIVVVAQRALINAWPCSSSSEERSSSDSKGG